MTTTEDIEEMLTRELGFYTVRFSTLEKRLKDISHTKHIGGDTSLYWSSKNRKFYLADNHRAWTGMDAESTVEIPKEIKTIDDAWQLVKALSNK